MLPTPFVYHRHTLAEEYCQAISGRSRLKDARSGLFLAAPRRTGKSTFLRQDMVPAILAEDWLPVYIDLWADRQRNPAEMISAGIARELDKVAPLPKRLLQSMGLQKLSVAGSSLETANQTTGSALTIPAALQLLWERTLKPIVLIIDEAQHALTTEEGQNMLFALKAARDQLNQEDGKGTRLMLVMTGSSRDKLSFMVTRKSQAFYGADITHFPLLDDGFVEAFAEDFNRQFADTHQFSLDALKRAFELVGRRPEGFRKVIAEAVLSGHGADMLNEMVTAGALDTQRHAWAEFGNLYEQLSIPQKAVLDAIARLTPRYSPYAADAMEAYQQVIGTAPSASTIQSAIKALQDKDLIWLAARGDYAFEDEAMRQWYLQLNPTPPCYGGPGLQVPARE